MTKSISLSKVSIKLGYIKLSNSKIPKFQSQLQTQKSLQDKIFLQFLST